MKKDNAKLIRYGTIKLKNGAEFPVYYVHMIEDDQCQVVVGETFLDVVQPYSSISNWRNYRDLRLDQA